MRQHLLVALIIITLIANVILGVELYTTLHPNINGGTNKTIIPISNVSMTYKANYSNSSLYSFSFETKLNLNILKEGKYIIGINPYGFKQLFVLIQLKDHKTIELTLNETTAIVKLNKDDRTAVTMFVSGETYANLNQSQIINNLNLYIEYINNN